MSTPADDAGDVAALRERIAFLEQEFEHERDRLQEHFEARMTHLHERDEARAEVDSLRVTLAAVGEFADRLDAHPLLQFAQNPRLLKHVAEDLRAALSAADPVSLADVRDKP